MAIVGVATTIEFCETLMRQIKNLNLKLPIIVVCAFKEIRGKEKLIGLGVRDWFNPPFDMEFLKRRVKELLIESSR